MEPDPPVVRVWKGESDPVGADAYFRHVTTDVADALARLPGFLGMTVWRRDVGAIVEFVVTTRWASVAHVERFAGRDIGRAVVEPAARAVLTRFDDCATHYDLAFELVRPR
jgi:antibiotic biosynthesis monooxygenase (ABM) superfamily enzyme